MPRTHRRAQGSAPGRAETKWRSAQRLRGPSTAVRWEVSTAGGAGLLRIVAPGRFRLRRTRVPRAPHPSRRLRRRSTFPYREGERAAARPSARVVSSRPSRSPIRPCASRAFARPEPPRWPRGALSPARERHAPRPRGRAGWGAGVPSCACAPHERLRHPPQPRLLRRREPRHEGGTPGVRARGIARGCGIRGMRHDRLSRRGAAPRAVRARGSEGFM